MLYLKLGTKEDYDDIIELLEELYSNSVYRNISGFVKADVVAHMDNILLSVGERGTIILLKNGDETIGVLIASHMLLMFNAEEKTAVELAFWIREKKRTLKGMKMLLGAYRYWAKKTGCTSILVGKLKGDKTVESYTVRKL